MDEKLIHEAEKDYVIHLNRIIYLTELILSQEIARNYFEGKGCTSNDLMSFKYLALRIANCLITEIVKEEGK